MNSKHRQRRFTLAKAAAIGIWTLSSPVFAANPPLGAPPPNAAVSQLIADAQKAIKAGNIPLAVIHLKNASSAAPKNGTVRAQLGIVLLQSGDYYSAERELRQARKDGAPDTLALPPLFQAMLFRHEDKQLLEEFPSSFADTNSATAADIYKAQALALQNLDQPAAAAAAMDKSLKLRTDQAGLITRARLAQQQKDLTAAMAFTDKAIALAPSDTNPLMFKFGILVAGNRLDEALKLSEDIVAKFPASIPARFAHVEALMRLNQNGKARSEVEAILAKNPTLAVGIYYRALLLAKAGNAKDAWHNAQTLPTQFLQSQPTMALAVSQMAENAGARDTAAAILSAAIANFPSDNNLRLRLAAARLRQNDTTGALNALEPIKDALDPATSLLLARIYLKVGRASDALAILQQLDEAGKGSDQITLSIVGLQAQQGQPEAAVKDLAQAVSKKPTDPMLVSQLVAAYARLGRFSDALAAADKLGADPKQRVPSLALRAQVQMAQRDMDAALASYNKALQAEPSNVISLYGRAGVLEAMKRYADANKDLNLILSGNSKNVAVYLKLAEIAALQGQDQTVRSTLEKAIQLTPNNPSPRIALIRYLLTRKDYKSALSAANDLAKAYPKNPQAQALLGQAQGAAGLKRESAETFRKVVAATPKSPAAQILLGNALQLAGDRAGAMSALRAAVSLDNNSPDVRNALISLQFSQGDTAGAVATAEAFRRANPTSVADIMLGDALLKAGRRDQAIQVYKQSYTDKPSSTTLMRVVRTAVSAGDVKSALDLMSKWLEKKPSDTEVRVEYANLLMGQKNNAKAAIEYQAVLQREPNNVMALNNLGWLKQSDDPQKAMALVSQAAKLAPDSPEVLDTWGWLKVQRKQFAEGLPPLTRAHQLRPNDGSITYHLIVAMDGTGKREAARGLLKGLLASNVKFDERDAAGQLDAKWH
jgi:putative PEP-CTERM system TPR-repeat lipoprotein